MTRAPQKYDQPDGITKQDGFWVKRENGSEAAIPTTIGGRIVEEHEAAAYLESIFDVCRSYGEGSLNRLFG